MRDVLAILFPYLVVLYLFDCIVRVRSGHTIFVSHFGRRYRPAGEGVHVVSLLPVSRAVLSHNVPLLLSPRGIHLPAAESRWDRPLRPQDLRFLSWDAIGSVTADGSDVFVNGNPALALPTAAAAAATAASLGEIAASPPARRGELAEAHVAASYDLAALSGAREAIRAPLLAASVASSLLFLCVFAVLPLALYARPFQGRSLAPVLLATAIAYVLAVAAACAARGAIDPQERPGRGQFVLLLVLVPPGAAHVLGPLTRTLFARYDHLALAAALAPPEDFRRMARREMARFALSEVPPGDAALADALRVRERAARRLLGEAGLDPEAILAAPRQVSPESERYCPACEAEYVGGADRCADCGVPLAAFGPADGATPGNRGQESACAKSVPG